MSFNLSEARLHAIKTLKKTVEKLTDENKALKEQEEKWPHAYALARDWSENERLKTEIEKLKETARLSGLFWECLMDCRGNPDNPDKQEIDEWCDSYKQSDEVRVGLYQSAGLTDEGEEEVEEEEEEEEEEEVEEEEEDDY